MYQKRYLLLLLGGFQECESATLSIISKLGVHPQASERQQQYVYSNGSRKWLRKFRIAGRSVIVILRLKFLVNKWKKVQSSDIATLLRKGQRFKNDQEVTGNSVPRHLYDHGIHSLKGSKAEIPASSYQSQASGSRNKYDVDRWLKQSPPLHRTERIDNTRINAKPKKSSLESTAHGLISNKSETSPYADQIRPIPTNSAVSWRSNGVDKVSSPQQGVKISARSTPSERNKSISPHQSPNLSENSDPALTRYIHKLEALHDRLAVLDTKNNK